MIDFLITSWQVAPAEMAIAIFAFLSVPIGLLLGELLKPKNKS